MSIQDESFPHDELFKLDSSPSPNTRFQFPHRLRQPVALLHKQHQQQSAQQLSGNCNKKSATTLNSSSTTGSSDNQTISSARSDDAAVNDCISKSDETSLAKCHKTGPRQLDGDRRSLSYQDIHSEYTKRRYKHVESKVGQYIANIRSEDERRRNVAVTDFQPLPDALARNPQMRLQRYAFSDADKLNEDLLGVIDGVEEEEEKEVELDSDVLARNMSAISSATVYTQSSSGAEDGAIHEGSEYDGSPSGKDGIIDKQTYALLLEDRDRIQSYNDYLQLKMDEKMGEIMRLKQNVDFLRVRLSTAEDKLKKPQSCRTALNSTSTNSLGCCQGRSIGGPSWGTGRQSLQGLLYCTAKSTKATQTETERIHLPSQPSASAAPLQLGLPKDEVELYVTPDTPNENDYCVEGVTEGAGRSIKSVAAIHPMSLNFSHYGEGESAERQTFKDSAALRRRSNSNNARRSHAHTVDAVGGGKSENNSGASHPSSGDSAIDIEVIELSSSPKQARRKRCSSSPPVGAQLSEYKSYGLHCNSHATPSPAGFYREHCHNSTSDNVYPMAEVGCVRRLPSKKHRTSFFRRRWLRLFRDCVRCSNPKQTSQEQFALQQTYTQIPLLEGPLSDSYQPRCDS